MNYDDYGDGDNDDGDDDDDDNDYDNDDDNEVDDDDDNDYDNYFNYDDEYIDTRQRYVSIITNKKCFNSNELISNLYHNLVIVIKTYSK